MLVISKHLQAKLLRFRDDSVLLRIEQDTEKFLSCLLYHNLKMMIKKTTFTQTDRELNKNSFTNMSPKWISMFSNFENKGG